VSSPTGSARVTTVGPDGLPSAAPTPGLTRELAFDTEKGILTRVRAAGGVTSGWHHHGDRDVLGHVIRGRARFEFGPGGGEHTIVEEGGFFHIPAGLVHRDVNPDAEPQEMVISFVGTGSLVVNVDGPDD
jgi:quercetin dioxygenase-like cupin family protein